MKKVLIVDDDRATSAGMADVVEEWGYEAEVADRKDGLSATRVFMPTLSICKFGKCAIPFASVEAMFPVIVPVPLASEPLPDDLDASLVPTSSGRRWLRARRPDLYGSLTRPTGQEQETRRVRFGE